MTPKTMKSSGNPTNRAQIERGSAAQCWRSLSFERCQNRAQRLARITGTPAKLAPDVVSYEVRFVHQFGFPEPPAT